MAANLSFLQRHRIWHVVTTNLPSESCPDAANKRNRLGHTGIPLSDELKTHVAAYNTEAGRKYVAVHCRGHQLRDDAKIDAVVGHSTCRVDADELESEFGLRYGMVNPVSFAHFPEVLQIFDPSVFERFFPPYTMMTNIGDLETAIEFHPDELMNSLPSALVADVVTSGSQKYPEQQCIGILTGNSAESGMELWQLMNNQIREAKDVQCRGDTDFPRVIVESMPEMGLSMELALREAEVRDVVTASVRRLCRDGATAVAIACNTTQYFSDSVKEVCSDYGATFVSLVDETAAELHRRNVTELDLLGIGAVADFEKWSDFRRLANDFTIYLPSTRQIDAITRLGYEVKKKGGGEPKVINQLRDIVSSGIQTNTILIALTELSLVMKTQKKRGNSERVYIDTLEVLSRSLANVYLDQRRIVKRQEEDRQGSPDLRLSPDPPLPPSSFLQRHPKLARGLAKNEWRAPVAHVTGQGDESSD